MGKQYMRRNHILSAALVLLLLIGLFPTAAMAATRLDPGSKPPMREAALTIEEVPQLDTSGIDMQLLEKQGIDADGVLTQAHAPVASTEEMTYVESVAQMLTEQAGVIGLDEYGPKDEVFVFVWLQELPTALERIYQAQDIDVADYAKVASAAGSARNAIRAMNTIGIMSRSSGTAVEIAYEYTVVFAGFALRASKHVVEKIAAMPGVHAVSEVGEYTLDYVADPDYSTPGNAGGRHVTEIADLHADGIDGTGVKVGVIDSGIDADHPDLAAAYKGGYNFAEKTDDMDKVDSSHGTHVAGTIASQGISSLGVAPGVELYMAQVFKEGEEGASAADTTAAVEDFSSDGGFLPRVDIINMSMGHDVSTAYMADHFVRNNAVLAGVLVVCSGGNNAYPKVDDGGRSNYTLGSGGVSLPLSVAAAKYGGDPLLRYDMTASAGETSNTITVFVENGNGSLSGLYTDGRFGYTEAHSVTYNAENTKGKPNWLDEPYYGTYQRHPLVYEEGKGYELYYACSTAANMTDAEMEALQAMPADSLVGKILVVNRGQSFNTYLGEAMRLGAGAVIVLNRDESFIGNMTIGNASAANISVFSGPLSGRQKLLDVVAAGGKAYFNPGVLGKTDHVTEPADFSSIGPVSETGHIKPDVIGPGWSILSTGLNGGYETMGGTSMSSPFVAGVAALVKQEFPNATPAEIKARIMNTANPDVMKPLTGRMKNFKGYFNPDGTEISVFEQGAGYVNPKRAVSEDIYITVDNGSIPTGKTDKSVMDGKMASFSFGNAEVGKDTAPLTATVHNAKDYTVDVVYNNNTRYSRSSEGVVEVKYAKNDDSFKVWLVVDKSASTDAKEGNLYEGYIIVTADGKTYTLPWAVRAGKAPEVVEDDWLMFPDRPIQATFNHANQDWAPYSSQNYIFLAFWGKRLADSVVLRNGPDNNFMDILLFDVSNREVPAYRIPVGVGSAAKLSDIIKTDGTIMQVGIQAGGYARKSDGSWDTEPSVFRAGSYYVGLEFRENDVKNYYNYYLEVGITFTETRPTLTLHNAESAADGTDWGDITLAADSDTYGMYPYGAKQYTVSGTIYSAAIDEAAKAGFFWAGYYLLAHEKLIPLTQGLNVLEDGKYSVPLEFNETPWICDANGKFALTFDVPADKHNAHLLNYNVDTISGDITWTPDGKHHSAKAVDAFDATLYNGARFLPVGNLVSYTWTPYVREAVADVAVTSATLTNGTLTAQIAMQDGSALPADFDPAVLSAQLTVNDKADRVLTDVAFDKQTGIATWTFAPYAKTAAAQVISAKVTCTGAVATTTADSNAITVSASLIANVRAGQAEYNIGQLVEYIVSLANVTNDGIVGINYVELTFKVDGNLLVGNGITPHKGFISREGIRWTDLGGGFWQGKLLLEIRGETILDGDADILALLFNAKGTTGTANLTLTGVKAQGITADKQYVLVDSTLGVASADTSLVPVPIVYSKYDLNRDGRVNSLDFGILLFYIGRSDKDADWLTYWHVRDVHGEPIFANLCDVTGDGLVDMGDLLEMLRNYN